MEIENIKTENIASLLSLNKDNLVDGILSMSNQSLMNAWQIICNKYKISIRNFSKTYQTQPGYFSRALRDKKYTVNYMTKIRLFIFDT